MDGDILDKNKSSIGTPFSSSMKLHDKIGNRKKDPVLISKSLFENAEDYYLASRIIFEHNRNLFSVTFANLAFSCELYLKSILFQFKNSDTKIIEHKLYELYKMLPSEQQAEIKTTFTSQRERKDDFELFFQEVSETFVFARYIHERNSACFPLELFNLALAIRHCAKNFYNAQILVSNKIALEKLEEYKLTNIEPSLQFWIYYAENYNGNIEIVAEMLVENLCDSLKYDFNNYVCGKKNDDWVREPAIILNFTRQGYIFSEEYNNIANISSMVFNNFGMSIKGLRTNGHQIFIQKEIK